LAGRYVRLVFGLQQRIGRAWADRGDAKRGAHVTSPGDCGEPGWIVTVLLV